MIYQVKDWSRHFENNKSRERDKCAFVCVPNKQHGMGFVKIMMHKDGATIYGIWICILGALSQQSKPRLGWLTDDGREGGRPWTAEDLALKFRRPASEVSRALEVISSEGVGWLCPSGARLVPAECPSGALEEKRNEEKRREGIMSGKPDVSPVEKFVGARVLLHFLNEKAGRHFQERGENLKVINTRLQEINGDVEGAKQMIERQCARWKGDPKMDEYLRISTLFAKTNFHEYYDNRDLPVTVQNNGKPTLADKLSKELDRATESLLGGTDEF